MKKIHIALIVIVSFLFLFGDSLYGENSVITNVLSEKTIETSEGETHGADMSPLFFIIVSLFIGVATRNILKKSPLPYTVALLVLGILIAIPVRINYLESNSIFAKAIDWAGHIDPHIIMFVFLPTLIFEAAFALDVHTFRKSFTNASLLAGPGLIIGLAAMAVIAILISVLGIGLLEWNWTIALLFGTIISATDPVAVVSLLKELGASKKLSTLVESESLLNDGTAIVVFMVIIGIITGTSDGNIAMGIFEFVRVSLGGTAIGLLIGWIVIEWLKRVFNDPLFEITIIVGAAYLTFFVAEHFFHVSGVLGLVSLGLLMAGVGRTRISPEVNHFLHEFWELAAFIANTLIFIIVGVVIALRTVFTPIDFVVLILIYIGITVVRGGLIVSFFPFMKRIGYGLSKKDGLVLWWGGLRGAIGLALALIVAAQKEVPEEIGNQILFLTAGIVLLTSFINATTTKPLVNKLGLTKITSAKASLLTSNSKNIRQSTENTLNKIKNDRYMKGADWDIVKTFLPHEIIFNEKDVVQVDPIAEVRKQILQKEKYSYWKQFEEGLLGRDAVQELSDTVSVLMDDEGKVSLSARKDMEYLWKTSTFHNIFRSIPIVKEYVQKLFFNRLATSYDCARGFVVAQEDMLKLLKSLALNVDDETVKLSVEDLELLEGEIYENRIQGLTFIRNLKEAFPEIYRAIETKQAIRTILNHQRSMVEKLVSQKRMEYDEAKKINDEIEEKMHSIMEKAPQSKTEISREQFSDILWLKDIPDNILHKIIDQFQQKVYSVGETIIKNKRMNGDIFIIQRGTAKIMFEGKTEDIVGPGSILGELSIIGNVGRDATVEAELPVTALQLSGASITKLMHDYPTLSYNLWFAAAKRFVEELLQFEPNFQNLSQSELRTYVAQGTLFNSQAGQKIKAFSNYYFLLSGKIGIDGNTEELSKPSFIKFDEFVCLSDCKVFILDKYKQ